MEQISRLILSCLMATALSGCATPAEMRQRTPDLELKSTFPSKEVSTCIADRWENLSWVGGTIPINMRPIEGGYTVSWRNEAWGHTSLLVDVKDIPEGSFTRYFKNAVLGEGTFDEAVKNCQDPKKTIESKSINNK